MSSRTALARHTDDAMMTLPTLEPETSTHAGAEARTETLPVDLIDHLGDDVAWAAVRRQAVARLTCHPEARAPFVTTLSDLLDGTPHWVGLLVALTDEEPSLVRRIAWSPRELTVAQALLDEAMLDTLAGPYVDSSSIRFWSDGRTLRLSRPWRVPVAALDWLATGSWGSVLRGVDGPGLDELNPRPLMGAGRVQTSRGVQTWMYDRAGHRLEGPATITEGGATMWLYRNQLHRAKGPAVVHLDGTEEWYRRGHRMSARQIARKRAALAARHTGPP